MPAWEKSSKVSIHAPRGRSDAPGDLHDVSYISFNPRSPWEERRARRWYGVIPRRVSIHAPRGRSDL